MSSTQIARSIRTRKLGLLIYDARQAARRSLEECAEAIGVTPEAFKEFEQGKKAPALPELEMLADYLEVPIEHFWGSAARSLKGPTREKLDWQTLLPPRKEALGGLLREARETAHLSLAEAAAQAGMAEDLLAAYEHGAEPVPVPEMEALAAAYSMDIKEFMDQDGPVGLRRKQMQSIEAFLALTPEQQAFILQPNNLPYIQVAMHLSGLPVDRLRAIAEGLLEITY